MFCIDPASILLSILLYMKLAMLPMSEAGLLTVVVAVRVLVQVSPLDRGGGVVSLICFQAELPSTHFLKSRK